MPGEMSHDAGPFADGELYDILCEGLDYGIVFYTNLARKSAGPVLDVACGTGRVTLAMLQAGADVDGVDLNSPMLERCRAKASAMGFQPRLKLADMAGFEMGRKYALVTIAFNALIHNLTAEDQIACLRCCRDHLLEGGLLAFDTFFPGHHVVGAPPATRVLEGELTDPRTGAMLRIWDTRTFDRVAQTQTSIMEIETEGHLGETLLLQRSEFVTRYIYRAEMELLLRLAGFRCWEIHGNFEGKPLTEETDAMIVLAQA